MVLGATFLATFVLLAAANPMDRRAMAVHETRAEAANGFVNSGVASGTTELTLRIAMAQNNIAGLEIALYAVSDPASAQYGQHLTAEEVAEYVKPTDAALSAVNAWLTENEISSTSVTPAGDIIQIVIPVSKANDLLSTEFSVFAHVESGKTSIRTLEYSIPADLQAHIDGVHPTVSFTRPLSNPQFTAVKAGKRAVPTSCNSVITPTCLQDMYGIPATPATQSTNKLAVSGFIDEWANEVDLTEFLQNFRTDVSSATTSTLKTLDGGVNTQTRADAGVEANLDIQYTRRPLTQGTTETAASFSAGGFSNYFGIPSYQATDVAAYLSTLGTTDSGKFNTTGRGYPDVAFQGVNFDIAWDTEIGTVSGTSCSSPAFASVIALLNDQLIAAGKSPLGFLNPFLYSAAGRAALNDITSGDNPGCSTNGFSAVAGWDPVTGLGTPNFTALQAAVGL
ncbi:Peptidase S53 domain-containing protein [Mycena sanguinolenta]|uniref:Peptidase S53 domain-containing protein n=1 Tax=Mycena sanguinolenta TaxID=230812 RepID=A0A8H6ZBF2_9AGAR|nr:Peptidase S53 domain-containing protein [Mycena sanguinolenta]